jgi:hypothetical protein
MAVPFVIRRDNRVGPHAPRVIAIRTTDRMTAALWTGSIVEVSSTSIGEPVRTDRFHAMRIGGCDSHQDRSHAYMF